VKRKRKPPQTLSNVFGRNTVLKHAQRLVNGQRKLKTVWDELRQASELSLQLKNLVRYTEPVTLTQGYLGLYCCETEKRLGNQLASSLRFLEPELITLLQGRGIKGVKHVKLDLISPEQVATPTPSQSQTKHSQAVPESTAGLEQLRDTCNSDELKESLNRLIDTIQSNK